MGLDGETNSQDQVRADEAYQLGRLQGELGDFTSSIEHLETAVELYGKLGLHRQFLKSLTLILRMKAEMDDTDGIRAIKDRLNNYVQENGIELTSVTYYTLALISTYRGDNTSALEQLEKALALALSSESKEDMCYAIHGLAVVYWSLGRTDEALKEIYNLRVFFQVMDLPDLKISSQILNGHILVSLKRYDEALDIFWQAFEALKERKNLYTYVSLLCAMGFTYLEAGETDLAHTYLRLAKQMADPRHFVYLTRKINEVYVKLTNSNKDVYDLVFDTSSNSVIERKKGRIDLKNQFILLDMLKLFLKNPGEVYSKEDLVKAVWRQDYDPSVHDNKIYVTIKRLRQLIEPDFDKPKYIYRAKNGYYLNRNAKISIEH